MLYNSVQLFEFYGMPEPLLSIANLLILKKVESINKKSIYLYPSTFTSS
jgi:hypothetical protein